MPAIDIVARAVDWLDACRSHTWQHMGDFYTSDAQVFVPGALPPHQNRRLVGVEQICAYWRETFGSAERIAFELVELYPGDDSVVLIYYDEKLRRISEFLQFDAAGLIKLSARHVTPMRPPSAGMDMVSASRDGSVTSLVLRCEARQSLGEARQLPAGSLRNALRQRAVALNALSKRKRDGDWLKRGA
jgi:hypothetical protein